MKVGINLGVIVWKSDIQYVFIDFVWEDWSIGMLDSYWMILE